MKKYTLNKIMIPFLVLFFCIKIAALGQSKNVVKLIGRIDTSLIKTFECKELIVKVRSSQLVDEVNIKIPLALDGSFNSIIFTPDSLTYLTFNIEDRKPESDNNGRVFNVSYPKVPALSEAYLFQWGDSISINIKTSQPIIFKGRGADKLNCQSQIYNLDDLPKSIAARSTELFNVKALNETLQLMEETSKLAQQLRLAILDSYKKQIPLEIYDRLYLDVIAFTQYNLLENYVAYSGFFPGRLHRSIIWDHYKSYLNSNYKPEVDSAVAHESAYYADLLFQQELTYCILSNVNSINQISSFKQIYDKINRTYSGDLRDKLLLETFVNVGKQKSSEAKLYISEALQLMNHKGYKQLLTEWRSKQYSAYPFELYDANNRLHLLSDYKGKVIVIDVWFTGCFACRNLAKAMHPIVEEYKGNRNIVFITISPDEKNKWLKSIASGQYTSVGSVNLYTNGLGWGDPMFIHYQWNGAPNQLIINKAGNLVTSSPPRADVSAEYTRKFKDIIEKTLKN